MKVITFIVLGFIACSAIAKEENEIRLLPWYGARVHECISVLGMRDLQEASFASVGRTYDNIFTRLREKAKHLAKENGLEFDSISYREPIEEGRYILIEEYQLLQCNG